MRLICKPLCGIIIKFEEEELDEAVFFLKTMAEGLIQEQNEQSNTLGKQIMEFVKQFSENEIGSA